MSSMVLGPRWHAGTSSESCGLGRHCPRRQPLDAMGGAGLELAWGLLPGEAGLQKGPAGVQTWPAPLAGMEQ